MFELRQFDGGDEEEEEEGKKEEEEVKGVLMEMKGNKMKEFSPSSSLSTLPSPSHRCNLDKVNAPISQ